MMYEQMLLDLRNRLTIHEQTEQIANTYFEPLCEATQKIFKPITFAKSDRLHLMLDEDGKHFYANVYGLTEDGQKGYASFQATTNWFRRLPERRQLHHYNKWWIAGTDFNVLVINVLWPKNQIIFENDAKILYDYLLHRFMSQTQVANIRAQYRIKGIIPKLNILDRIDKPLAPYQRVGLAGQMHQEGQALFMEQGTGKTPIIISRLCNESAILNKNRLYRVLVVCPKNVRTNWRIELNNFATVSGKVAVLRGGQLKRVKLLVEAFARDEDCKWTVIISSYETVIRSWAAIRMIEWDLCVLDESHYIKSTRTKRFKKMMLLRDLCKQRSCLTGTPVTNTLFDLYAQFEFLGEGLSGFSNYKSFRSYYSKYVRRGKQLKLVDYKNVPLIQERLTRLAFLITKKEALPELPDKVTDIIDVEMTKIQLDYYKKIANQLAIEAEHELAVAEESGRNKQLICANILTKMLRLAQITSGFITWDAQYSDEGKEIVPKTIDRIDPNPKLESLVEILKIKGPHEKTIIWACWVQDIRTIAARLKLENIEAVTFYGKTSDKMRDEAVERFNGDQYCKVFIGNPSAGGSGLNLFGHSVDKPDEDPCNCNHVIYYSQNWSMVHRSQSEDRAHRRGTRVQVRYTDLCVPNSIDEEIRERVVLKRIVALNIQNVRDILKRVMDILPDIGD